VEGEKISMWIPERLGYKDNQQGPHGDLVFDVELLKIQ